MELVGLIGGHSPVDIASRIAKLHDTTPAKHGRSRESVNM